MRLSDQEIRQLLERRGRALNPVATTREVEGFEARHAMRLPDGYRSFILMLGNGGAGPSGGFFPLGKDAHGALPPRELEWLRLSFDADAAEEWELSTAWWELPDVMVGTLCVAEIGCGAFYSLVVTGPNAGEIWRDERADGEAPEQLTSETGELLFREWYENWLLFR